jgi:hypothetical protein
VIAEVSQLGRFDARELFKALARRDVDYLTIGGIAIQAHGGQRLTQDLDVAIASSTDNITRLAKALLDLDARILGPDGQRSQSVPTAPLLASSLNRSTRHPEKPHFASYAANSLSSGSRSPRSTARSTSTQSMPRACASTRACGLIRCAASTPRQEPSAGSRRIRSR